MVKSNLSAIRAQLRAFILLFTAYYFLPSGLVQQIEAHSAQPIHAAVVRADLMPGADAGAKIAACFAAISLTNPICDARGFTGAQVINADPSVGLTVAPVLLLGQATITLNASINPLLSNTQILGFGTTVICAVTDDCIKLGNVTNATITSNNIKVDGLTIEPGAGSVGKGSKALHS